MVKGEGAKGRLQGKELRKVIGRGQIGSSLLGQKKEFEFYSIIGNYLRP